MAGMWMQKVLYDNDKKILPLHSSTFETTHLALTDRCYLNFHFYILNSDLCVITLWKIPYGKGRSRERDWNKFINAQPNSTVADLGAGGGFTLSTLNVKRKIAIEVNDVARDYIRSNFPDIEAYKYPEDVPDFESIDILLSIDAVEHMECPITELKEMEKKVRPGGRLVRQNIQCNVIKIILSMSCYKLSTSFFQRLIHW